jgi:hypothetical protein
MQLRYDEDFVEQAVFLWSSGSRNSTAPPLVARFHRERESLYSILDPDERNAAFFKLHLEWFREWGLEKILTCVLEEFPLLRKALRVLAFRKAHGKKDDGAELYVDAAGDRTGVMSLHPERLRNEAEVTAFLRHELLHLQDMVDPGYGYLPELMPASPSPRSAAPRDRTLSRSLGHQHRWPLNLCRASHDRDAAAALVGIHEHL